MKKTYSGVLEYPGYHGTPSCCQIDLWREGEKAIVMMTKIAENTGTSITNRSEVIAEHVAFQHLLFGAKTTWIEHYGPMSYHGGRRKDTYAQVIYDWSSGAPVHPEWFPLSKDHVYALVSA